MRPTHRIGRTGFTASRIGHGVGMPTPLEPDHFADGSLRLRMTLDDAGEVLEVSGELDVATVDQFDAAVQLLLSSGRTHITVRMADVSFVDSSGLGALLRAHKLGRDRDVPFEILDASERVRSLITLTALDATLQLASSGV
jgi:anti-anti-sigma factor